MIIGIDGNEANIEKRVGIGQYAYQLLMHMYKQIQDSEFRIQNLQCRVYLKDEPRADMPEETAWWRYNVFGPKKFWTQIALPYALYSEREKPHVFFSPSHYAPRFSPIPQVISLMDMSFVHFPALFTKKDLWQLEHWTSYSVKKAKKILTISEFSKKEIMTHYHIPEERIVVTYPGYDEKQFRIHPPAGGSEFRSERKKVKEKYHIYGDYILFVGTLQPRKNIVTLLEAFGQINSNIQLVLVGKRGWLYDEIEKTVQKLDLSDSVLFLDYTDAQDLPDLYRYAKCFVLPSLYEGFGLTVLEALACGCPVVVSRNSSLPEVAGSAGIYIEDPLRKEDIIKGIQYVRNADEQTYAQLREKAVQQAKKFHWNTCAHGTLAVLEEVGNTYAYDKR